MSSEGRASSPGHRESEGAAIGAEDVARLVQRSLTEIAVGLECPRLVVLSFSADDSLLRGVRTVGFEMPGLRDLRLSLNAFPAAEQALRMRQIRPLSASTGGLPEILHTYLHGELVVVPLVMGERKLAVLVGQIAPNVSVRSPQWQERAAQFALRATLLAELVRLSGAYQDECRLRQATQAIIAAILEGRPLSEVAGMIADQVAASLGEERVGLYLLDDDGRYLPAALRNVSAEYADGIMRLRRQGPFTARALATHLPYYTPDAQNDPQVTPALRALLVQEDIRSLLIAMLHHGDRISGALAIYPLGERRFTPREMTLVQARADQATLAILIAQQLEQQRDVATAEERNRLAREIHDTVAQSLTGVLMQVETAETYLRAGDYTTVSSLLESAREQSRKALDDTRRAVQGLAPPSLEQRSLAEALMEESQRFETVTGIGSPFITSGEEHPLTAEQSIALLRVAQEALNNARKHSQATRVRVGLQYGTESVVLMVEDDGIGFDTANRGAPDSAGGYGLFGMEERARLLGGEAVVESTPLWGTRVRASIPYRLSRDAGDSRASTVSPRPANGPAPGRDEALGAPDGIRVLVADDHAIVRQGLRDVLEAQGGLQIAGEAENGAQAVERALELRPDVVLMDLQMPDVDGLDGLRLLHEKMPDLPVIVLTTFDGESSIAQALAAGARGYLLKDADPADLAAAIRAVHRGESQFSSAVTGRLASLAGRASHGAQDVRLNDREREVLDLLAQGARNKEVAARLFITVSTVEKHISNLFAKLGVSNRAEAVRTALDLGLISGGTRTREVRTTK